MKIEAYEKYQQNMKYYLKEFSLYESLEITADNISFWYRLFKDNPASQVDIYCVSCQKETTYKISNPHYGGTEPLSSSPTSKKRIDEIKGYHLLKFKCTRRAHEYQFLFYVNQKNQTVQKVGQYPSLADLEIHEIEKYRKILKKDYGEFAKAIGLFANGIGVGSFVYLRRIFENLIYEAYEESSNTIEDFNSLKMKEKIKTLKGELPDVVHEIPQLYGILSKGIHELGEDECKEIFPQLKIAIEMILDEKLADKEKAKKVSKLKSFISDTAEKLSK
jgi:hypothetical protein